MPDDQSLSTDPAAIGSNLEAQAAQEAKAEGQVATIQEGIATPRTGAFHWGLIRPTPLLSTGSLARMLLKPDSSLHPGHETKVRILALCGRAPASHESGCEPRWRGALFSR
jgi:hypothetical protein